MGMTNGASEGITLSNRSPFRLACLSAADGSDQVLCRFRGPTGWGSTPFDSRFGGSGLGQSHDRGEVLHGTSARGRGRDEAREGRLCCRLDFRTVGHRTSKAPESTCQAAGGGSQTTRCEQGVGGRGRARRVGSSPVLVGASNRRPLFKRRSE